MIASSRQRACALAIHLGPEALEAQRVISVGADLTAVLKPRRALQASTANVTMGPE